VDTNSSTPALPSELITELCNYLLSEPRRIDCKRSEKISPTEEPYVGKEQARAYWQNPSDAFKALSKEDFIGALFCPRH